MGKAHLKLPTGNQMHLLLCSNVCMSVSRSTSAWVTWSAERGITATPPQDALPTPTARLAAEGRGPASGTQCVAPPTAAATVKMLLYKKLQFNINDNKEFIIKILSSVLSLCSSSGRYLCSWCGRLCVWEESKHRWSSKSANQKERKEEGSQRIPWQKWDQCYKPAICLPLPPSCFSKGLCVCFRSGRKSLLALIWLLGRSVLCPSLLDPHLQAHATWRTGLHATPTQREPWSRAVPALSLWGRTHLPDTARTWYPASCSVRVQLLGNLISLLLGTVFRFSIISSVQGKASRVSPN